MAGWDGMVLIVWRSITAAGIGMEKAFLETTKEDVVALLMVNVSILFSKDVQGPKAPIDPQ